MQRIGHQHDPSLKSVTNISAARIKVDPLYRTLIFPVWVEDDFNKVGYVFPMVVVSILLRAEFGPNDHREDAPHFIRRDI